MFEVQITADARQIIERAIASRKEPKMGLMIHRKSPVGDNLRGENGLPTWTIERPYPWAIQIGSYKAIPDDDETIVVVDGIRIWLPVIPRQGELGVIVTSQEGKLHVEAI